MKSLLLFEKAVSTQVVGELTDSAGIGVKRRSGSHLLTVDFDYSTDQKLSFDMHALANASDRGTQAGSGVRVSFLDSFNVFLGSAGLFNCWSSRKHFLQRAQGRCERLR